MERFESTLEDLQHGSMVENRFYAL